MLAAALARPAHAQSVAVGIEVARDRFTYHFDNPSAFDTPQLVPHFFEQSYVADNVWLVGSLKYVAGLPWETSAAATLDRTAPATDYDTFFNPDGAIIVAGTSGDAVIHSFRVSQRVELGRAGPVTFVAGYLLRMDRADFLVGHKTVERNGRIVDAFDVTTPEKTSSLVQEFVFGALAEKAIGSGWRLGFGGEAAPTTTGRLTIELPDKYPGQRFLFSANALMGTARVTVSRLNRQRFEVTIEAAGARGYASENSLSRRQVGVRFALLFP